MLIEFKVANFRSIREEQKLSLVASNADKNLPGCLIEGDLPGLSGVKFLRGAAIYGPNASGKSNVLDALHFLWTLVRTSATRMQAGDPTGAQPFRLDQHSGNRPSEFEVTFVADGVRYVYGLSVTPERVLEEYLVAYPKGAPRQWFRRTYRAEGGGYEWARPSAGFKGDRSLQEKTRGNALFLSVGPQFDHPQLTPIFRWFKENLRFLRLNADFKLPPNHTAHLIKNPDYSERILSLLRSADIGVTGISIREKEVALEDIRDHVPPLVMAEIELKGAKSGSVLEVELTHRMEGGGSASLDFDREESIGTRHFFSLLGPWVETLDKGYTVLVDEIETSLHPLLVRELLKLIFCTRNNPKGAQIIFTTHNPLLLDGDLLRRDQVWFTEKTDAGTTRLYPLTDFQPRKGEALPRGYLGGRYGAVPHLREGLKL